MLSSTAVKAVPVSYTQSSVNGNNLNVLAGFGGDGLLYGLIGGSAPARMDLTTNTITTISSGSVNAGAQERTAMSANNIMFAAAFVSSVWTFYSIGPYTGTQVPVTQIFVTSLGVVSSVAVDATGTTLYVHSPGIIQSYTGWNGTTATATVLSSSVNYDAARIARSPTGTFYITNSGGYGGAFATGVTVNYTMTPAGVISSMVSSINISGAIVIDADGLPIITGGSGTTAYITKLTASTATILNGSSFDASAINIALNPASRVICVRPSGANLIIYTPNY